MGTTPTMTKQILFQQTALGDATMRVVAKLANVSNAEVIREATALGLPLLIEQYGLTVEQVETARTQSFPDLDPAARANRGGIRIGNAKLRASQRKTVRDRG